MLPPKANAIDWLTHSQNNFSWAKAKDVDGRSHLEALKILGHTLHLVQDSTVPLHVRSDAHPFHKDYEGKADKFSTVSWWNWMIDNQQLRQLLANNALSRDLTVQELIKELATYTSSNYLSDDTMPSTDILQRTYQRQDRFLVRSLTAKEQQYFQALAIPNEGYIRLAEWNGKNYEITDDVAENYWEILSVTAIEYGLAVMKKFSCVVLTDPKTCHASDALIDSVPPSPPINLNVK